jgi:hypothetical protein
MTYSPLVRETNKPHKNMIHVTVAEYKSGEPLGRGTMTEEKFVEYEESLAMNPTGAVRLSDWLTGEDSAEVMAQDSATVYFEKIEMRSAE